MVVEVALLGAGSLNQDPPNLRPREAVFGALGGRFRV